MRRVALLALTLLLVAAPAKADESIPVGGAETQGNLVRVTLLKRGSEFVVQAVHGAGATHSGCRWSVLFTPELTDVPYGTSAGPQPDPAARFALLLCNGNIVRAIWVLPRDILDVDAAVRQEAERYVREVLTPAVSIGVNPSLHGLTGLRSWFWIDGFSGSITAPPISAFGLTVDVRMTTRSATWAFGDGTTTSGDLGRAYPEESTVRHAYRDAGQYRITAVIHLATEYRIDGGGWLPLPDLTATASTTHQVEAREPVVTDV